MENTTPQLDIKSAASIMGRKGGKQTLMRYGKKHFQEIRKKSKGHRPKLKVWKARQK